MTAPAETARFYYQGRPLTAPRGATVAAALLANGITSWRKTRGDARPRGLFCGIGNCYDCLVDTGAGRPVRACQVVVCEGDDIRPLAPWTGGVAAGPSGGSPAGTGGSLRQADVAVVGAGPAGMSAALAAAEAGCTVILVDTAAQIGGQIYRQDQRLAPGASTPAPLTTHLPPRFRQVIGHPGIRLAASTAVWHAQPAGSGFRLHCAGPDTAAIDAATVVLATGATEFVLPFPGWTLPGVVTAGAAQAMIKAQGTLVGRRVLIAGTGPLLLPAAVGLAQRGAKVIAVCEMTRPGRFVSRAAGLAWFPGKAREAAGYAAALARHRIPLRPGYALIAGEGGQRVERAVIAPVDVEWRVTGRPRALAVDAVAVSMGFVPALELARALECACDPLPHRPAAVVAVGPRQETSTAGVFACGEATGVGGADLAEAEGVVAGAAAAHHLGRLDNAQFRDRAGAPLRRVRNGRRFAAWLDGTYPLASHWMGRLQPGTTICRCEEVTWADLAGAFALGAADLRAVKGLTRCGMGYCQGRVCGPVLQYVTARQHGLPLTAVGDLHSRPIAVPTTLGKLAAAPGTGTGPARGR